MRIKPNREREARKRAPSNLSNERPGSDKDRASLHFSSGFPINAFSNAQPNRQIHRLQRGSRKHPAPASAEAVLFKNSSRCATGAGRSSESHHAGVPQLVEGCVANAKVAGSSPAACSTSGVPLHSVQRSHGNGWAGCARLAACSERTHTGPCVLALGHSRSGLSITQIYRGIERSR